MRGWGCAVALVLAACAGLWAEEAGSEEKADQLEIESPASWWEGDYLTGNWKGQRDWMAEHGIDFQIVYTGDLFSNTRGGLNTKDATDYLGNLDFSLELDTQKMGGWEGGTFYFRGQNNHGNGITQRHVGGFQMVSNIEPEQSFTAFSEYWYGHELLDGKLSFKAGRQEANADFAATDNGGYFVQSSAGAYPTLSVPTFPDTRLGVAAFYSPTEFATIQAGLFEGGELRHDEFHRELKAFVDKPGGHVALAEFQLNAQPLTRWLPGTYRFGAWLHSGEFGEIPPVPENVLSRAPRTFSSNRGVYATFDQMLYKEKEAEDDEQGLSMFFQFGLAPSDRNEAARYFGGGLAYKGLIPSRDQDVLGVFVGHTDLSKRLKAAAGLTHETVIELTYSLELSKFLKLQPDFQHFIRPGGDGGLKNANVLGLRWVLSF